MQVDGWFKQQPAVGLSCSNQTNERPRSPGQSLATLLMFAFATAVQYVLVGYPKQHPEGGGDGENMGDSLTCCLMVVSATESPRSCAQ